MGEEGKEQGCKKDECGAISFNRWLARFDLRGISAVDLIIGQCQSCKNGS